MDILAQREDWPRAQLETYQLDRLNELWRHSVTHVPYYRKLKLALGLPGEFASMAQFRSVMPEMEKSTVVDNTATLIADNASSAGKWHRTSGSTGTPMRVYKSHEEHRETLQAKYRFYQTWGLDIFDRMAWLWSSQDAATFASMPGLGQRLQRFKDRLRNRLRMPAAELSAEAMKRYMREIARFQPKAMYAFSQAAYIFALEAAKSHYRCRSLKFVCMSGETATRRMRQTVEKVFGVPAIMEYGSVDCGFLAGEAPDRTLRIRSDIADVETILRPDGLYDIAVTPLTNYSFPLFRYRIGDVTDAPIVHPESGLPILGEIAGRNDDVLLARDGRKVHAASIDELFEYQFDSTVRQFRIHQSAEGGISVLLVLHDPRARFDPSIVSRKLGELVAGYPIETRIVETIPQTEAGKHRLVTSDLARAVNSNDRMFEQVVTGARYAQLN
jgi:phenylacetate-CoA ligase